MINIDYTQFQFKIKKDGNADFIYDNIRKNWIVLTPEEWVRQNFIQHLITVLQYPSSLIAVEKQVTVNQQKKRFDIVIYKNITPWMLIECKQPDVVINDNTLQQILAYNTTINAAYFVVTNGNTTYCWSKESSEIKLMNELPNW